MTTTIFLVRHAAHDLLGRVLTGRMPGVRLGTEGRLQVDRLAGRLSRETVSAVYTSPLERALETAAPIASRLGIEPEISDELTDIEFGGWSGKTFEALQEDPTWATWNSQRQIARPPGGESMLDVQWRAVTCVERLSQQRPGSGAVVVSHADVIKSVLAHYLGLALDAIGRFEVSPASVSTLLLGPWGAKVQAINEVVEE